MAVELTNNEQVERVRQAVLQLHGEVTVGDIVSKTGLGTYEAKVALNQLMSTHEGVMRVSDKGEVVYAFAPGCVLRDQRTWWERNRKAVMKGVRVVFKVIIMLTLIIYFIIFLMILIALMCSNRNNNNGSSHINIPWVWWFFWGNTSSAESRWAGEKKVPLYQRISNFVFGPEMEELDPLEARTKCAQLVRAKKGVITVEDWVMVSGQSREKCESDLARYTAEFDGNVEISDNGTVVYTFAEMMQSKDHVASSQLPVLAWDTLEPPRSLSGNINGGDGIVIGLNAFNLIMSGVCFWAGSNYAEMAQDPAFALQHGFTTDQALTYVDQVETLAFWLGTFPLIFSSAIFAGPLVRLPGHLKENRARRERSVRKAVMYSIFNKNVGAATRFSRMDLMSSTNMLLSRQFLNPVTDEELDAAMAVLMHELGGNAEFNANTTVYTFKDLDLRMRDIESERKKLALDQQKMGNVVFSTDSDEQFDIEYAENKEDLDAFDQALFSASKPQRKDEYGFSSAPNQSSSRYTGF